MMLYMHDERSIRHNISAHDRVATTYEQTHGEIYNPIEQDRLHRSLREAEQAIETGAEPITALDHGCGSGNLTEHLLNIGCRVIAADVSLRFLKVVQKKFSHNARVTTLRINGKNLEQLTDASVDMVATYSVLHHIPDYLNAIKEMIRVLKPGGVLYIDHEHSLSHWKEDSVYMEFASAASTPKRRPLTRFFYPRTYMHKIRTLINPRYEPEGDIHVFADDHIEWGKIVDLLAESNCEVLKKEDYLVYKAEYKKEVYDAYASQCADMTMVIARKCS
jgi:ubiquinone/menaquinone biosynthesis C-methylase UbiE